MSWISRIYNIRDFIAAVLPPPGDNESPTVPGTPTVLSLSATSLYVSFGASTDNTAVIEYQVQRSVNGGAFADYTTLTHPTTSFTDGGLTEGTPYAYKARARDAVPNWSAYSNSGSGTPTTPVSAGTVGVTTRTGAQLDLQEERYSSAGRYLDLMKRSAEPEVVGSVVFRRDGWLASIGPGAQVTFNLFLDGGPYSYLPPGDYVVKGGGSITKIPSGISGATTSTSRAYFTVPNNPDATTPPGWWTASLRLTLRNDTGSTLFDVEGVVVCLLSNEAAVDAGQIITSEFAALYQHMNALRTMACNNAMALPGAESYYCPKKPSELLTKNCRSYSPSYAMGTPYTGGDGFVPYDAIAQVISQLGPKDWHVNMPVLADAMRFMAYASTDRFEIGYNPNPPLVPIRHDMAEGQRVYFRYDVSAISGSGIPTNTVLYVRNPTAYDFQLSTTPGGAILDVTRDCGMAAAGDGYTYYRMSRDYTRAETIAMYDAIAVQIRDNLTNPDVRIVVEVGNEVGWNNGYVANEMWAWFLSASPEHANYGSAVATVGLAYASLLAYASFLKVFPRHRLRLMMCGQVGNIGFSNDGLQYVDPGFVRPGRKFCDIIDHFGIGSYYSVFNDPYLPVPGETYADAYPSRLWPWWTERTAWLQDDAWWINAYQYALQEIADLIDVVRHGEPYRPGLHASHNPTIQLHDYETNVDMFLNGFANAISIPYTAEQQLAQDRFNALLESTAMRTIHQVHWNNHVSRKVLTFQQFGVLGFYYRFFIGGWALKHTVATVNNPRTEWYMGGASLPGRPTSIGTARSNERVFISGHSLSSSYSNAYFAALATYMGVTHQYEQQIILGSPIKLRTGTSPTWAGFSQGTNKAGQNNVMNYLSEWDNPTSVTGGDYTVLMITENHQLMQNLRWNESHKYLLTFMEAFMSRSPGANDVILWTCWHPGDAGLWDTTVDDFIFYETKMAHLWAAWAWRMNLTLANKGYSWRVRIAPAAWCVMSLVDRACNGNLPGITQGSVQATIDLLFNDPAGNNVHMTTPQGLYYLACVHMAVVFNRSPVGAPAPAGVTAQQAASLQEQAWRSLLEYYNLNEWEPYSMTYARKFASEDASTTSTAHLSPSADSAFFASAAYGSGNPFVFDAATDNANAGWFTAP